MVVNAQIIKKNGKKEFAVLPYDEFQKIEEELASYEDLRCLREEKLAEKDAPTIGIAELKKRIRGQTIQSSRPRKLGG
ncbi:MAG: type II toxin-antitoxin system Phd/YefM family antitoxin [Deltaproteobacteria bacterium]|nr:type II toxin-antitoxin system Phd/YefM family antitoxin [Deltaproteobacteria bacterium]